jgi:septal ring factor EnvC (AmiA/AmiB activator)
VTRGLVSVAGGCLMVLGCAVAGPPAPAPPVVVVPEVSPERIRSQATLARADDELIAGNYRAAVAIYDHFLELAPDDEAAPRAHAIRAVIDRLLSAQTAARRLERDAAHLEDEIEQLRGQLTVSRKEAARLRADLDQLKQVAADLERLKLVKADLERLKETDLRLERRAR